MWKLIKAFSLADVTNSQGERITLDAWNLTKINELHDNYDWPRPPLAFTTHQKYFWLSVLCKAFLENHSIQSSRNFKVSLQLGAWKDPDIRKKWKYFYSIEESYIYEHHGNNWKFYSTTGKTCHQQYNTTNKILILKPASASFLESVDPRNNGIVLTSKVSWHFTIQDEYTIYANYKLGPFESIEEAFTSSVNCKQILFDKCKLPKDQCVAIEEVIQCGTARAISDRSFDRIDQLGT